MKTIGYKLGYKCPFCQYIQVSERLTEMIDKPNNTGMSNIKCPVCENEEFLKNWEMVKYPIIKEQ